MQQERLDALFEVSDDRRRGQRKSIVHCSFDDRLETTCGAGEHSLAKPTTRDTCIYMTAM